MPLSVGTRLGCYEITGRLGAGGMGEVYRAIDSDLKRTVAIKVLPDHLLRDRDRLARFQREAEILAALNHPHIAHVHGLEKTTDHVGLIMELVDGPTLAEQIARGPLAVEEALAIARQIAEALEAAHDRGVVHRDLKPANIKVRPDGQVKVLDFGLAKLIDANGSADGSDQASMNASTIADPALTHPGAVLGTPAYMAPEQIKGSAVDRRGDIWAFGCVLYELLAGHRAFDAPSVAETLAAVVGREPDWSRLPADVPPHVVTLVRRCLAREPRQRVSQMAVVLFALDEPGVRPGDVTGPTRARDSWKRLVAVALGSALVGALVTSSVFRWLAPGAAPARVARTTIAEATYRITVDRTFAISADGTKLAFVSADARDIRIRSLDALDATTVLTTSSHIRGLAMSPDGQWLGFFENAYILKKIPMAGGASTTLVMTNGPSRGASWGPDDTIVFGTGEPTTGIQRISVNGGPVTVLTRPNRQDGEADHVNPVWLPGGRAVLFTITAQTGGLDAAKVAVVDIPSGETRTLVNGAFAARYVGGYLVYAAADALWATHFDLDRRETRGSPVKVLPQMMVGAVGGLAQFDLATDGTLIYPRGARDYFARTRVPVWVDRRGRETRIEAPLDAYQHPRLSPFDTRLAVVLHEDIYVMTLTRPTAPFRLTSTPGSDWYPVWTPNGRRIVFGSWRGGGFSNLYVQDADGAAATRLTDSPEMQLPTSISPDGGTVVFNTFPKDLHALRLLSPPQVTTLASSALEERNGAISPDGQWLAYEGETPSRPGVLEIFVQSFTDPGGGTWQVTKDGGTFPVWSRSARPLELYYLKLDGTLVALPVETNATTWRPGTAVELFRGPYFFFGDSSMGRHYDVGTDGRFLMIKETDDPTPRSHFVVVQNWIAELQRLIK